MTSLCPGPVFLTPGLNQNSTPTPPATTPTDIDRKLRRQPFNGHDWPRDSPVAGVYDITNTSTSLVLLNKRIKKSKLRGQTEYCGEIFEPDPKRHFLGETSVDWSLHEKCRDISTPTFRPKIQLNLGWVNSQERPQVMFDGGSPVNQIHHSSCRVSSHAPVLPWAVRSRPHTVQSYRTESELGSLTPLVNDPQLSSGERRYLYTIARIYSTGRMKQLKQDQYRQLLVKELTKGYHTAEKYENYLNYLNTPRKTPTDGLKSSENQRRSQSAPIPCAPDSAHKGRRYGQGSSRHIRERQYSSNSRTSSSFQSSSSRYSSSLSSHRSDAKTPTRNDRKPHDQRRDSTTDADHDRQTIKDSKPQQSTSASSSQETGRKGSSASSRSSEAESLAKERRFKLRSPSWGSKTDDEHTTGDEGVSPRKTDEKAAHVESKESKINDDEDKKSERNIRDGDKKSKTSSNESTPKSSRQSPANTNLLALIVSDAEKESKESRTASPGEARSDTEGSSSEGEDKRRKVQRDFSSTELASGYTQPLHKEGRDRPKSRAGRESQVTLSEEEVFDESCTPVEKETDGMNPSTQNREDGKKTVEQSSTQKTSSQEERNHPSPSPALSGSDPEQDVQAKEPCRSVTLPIHTDTDQTSQQKDLSAETRNPDVSKIEY